MENIDLQRLYSKAGYYKGDLDGDLGPKSLKAARSILENNWSLVPLWAKWGKKRQFVAAGQLVLKFAGYSDEVGKIDGYSGPSTKYAYSQWDYYQMHGKNPDNDWRDDDIEQENESAIITNHWPMQSQIERFFGKAGGSQCTAGEVILPFTMKIAWNKRKKISKFSCHEKVADSAQRCYNKIADRYSPNEISEYGMDLFGGCYSYRKMRGGKNLSTHAYGIAIDTDPERNQLKWKSSRAKLAEKKALDFWRIWESEGWLSLGRARDYDWMHVQAARI